MAKRKQRVRSLVAEKPKADGHRISIISIIVTLAVGVPGLYFAWISAEVARGSDQRAVSAELTATAAIAVNRYNEFQDVTRHVMIRRVQLATALAKPDLVRALASPQMHFVMSDDWKAVFETTPDEVRIIANSSPDASRAVAECTAQALQLNTTITMGRDQFNMGPAKYDPQGMEFRSVLGLVKSSLETTQKACMAAADDLYALAYPNREPRSHMLENDYERLIAELAKKQIDLSIDPAAMTKVPSQDAEKLRALPTSK